MKSTDVRVGIVVIWRKQRWTVWDKAPDPNCWWIVREQKYESVHAKDLTSAVLDKVGRALAKADHDQEAALDALAPAPDPELEL